MPAQPLQLDVTNPVGTKDISSLELVSEACLHCLWLGSLFQLIYVWYVCRDPSMVEVQLSIKRKER